MNEAIRQVTHVQNIRYDKATERLYIIDQTLLPNEEKEIELRTVEEMIEAIKMLRIRGAPAIGICAGYCMYALARDIDAKDNETFYRKLQIDGELLGAARPTAVNLRWAVGEMLDAAKAHLKDNRAELLEVLYRKAVDIHEDDIAKCTAISECGLSLLKDGDAMNIELLVVGKTDSKQCRSAGHLPVRHRTGPLPAGGGAGHPHPRVCRRDPPPSARGAAHQL